MNLTIKKIIRVIGEMLINLGNTLIVKSATNPKIPYRDFLFKRKIASIQEGDVQQFLNPEAIRLTNSRLDHLKSLGLPLSGKRILDVGCGIGLFAAELVRSGSEVIAIDARNENVEEARKKFPHITFHCKDIEKDDLSGLGEFDLILCYGTLYHLENIPLALRTLTRLQSPVLLIESVISDHVCPISQLADEHYSKNQALRGIAHRPSPGYIAMLLNRIGYAYVQTPKEQPLHSEFNFKWKNNAEYKNHAGLLRQVIVASSYPLNPNLFYNLFDE